MDMTSLKLSCCRQRYFYFEYNQHFTKFSVNLLFILNLHSLLKIHLKIPLFTVNKVNRFWFFEYRKKFPFYFEKGGRSLSIKNINIFCLFRTPVIYSLLHYPAERSSTKLLMVLERNWTSQDKNLMP